MAALYTLALLALCATYTSAKLCARENLSVGDEFIKTDKDMKRYVAQNPKFVLAVSSATCRTCCHYEPDLAEI
jgi:hypothetical protein